MAKIIVEDGGKISIPEEYLERYGLREGSQIHLWSSEDGLILQRPGTDLRHVYIEPTSLCNLNCITCVRNVWSDETGHMDMDTFHTIARQLGDFPHIRGVTLAGFGEPLYHPGILEMVRLIKELELEVTISTNGTLLNSYLAEELVDIGLDKMVVSLDSADPELFRSVRAGADLEAVLDNLRRLNEIKRRRGVKYPAVSIEFVAMRRNVHEVTTLPRLGTALCASSIVVTNLLPHTEDMREEILYNGNSELPKCIGWPANVGGSWLLWGMMSYPRMYWGADRYCRFVRSGSMVIGWDGGVSPCYALMHSYRYYIFDRPKDVSRYTIGNVRETKLLELWTCEEYVKFRHKVRAFAFPSCVDCGIGCGYTDVNEDCWGASPSCADCLYAQGIIRCP